jgi:hypothetical protein
MSHHRRRAGEPPEVQGGVEAARERRRPAAHRAYRPPGARGRGEPVRDRHGLFAGADRGVRADLAAREGIAIETVRNAEWERPNGLSVLAAASKLERQFLLLMSDHLFDPEMLAGLIAAEGKGALTLAVDYRTDNPLIDLDDATKVEADAAGRIVRLGKTLVDYNCIDTGLFRAGPALIEAIQHAVAHGGAGSLSEGVQVLADPRRGAGARHRRALVARRRRSARAGLG